MRRRLYFVMPDLATAIRTAHDLLLARIEDRHMHFVGPRGMSLGELHEASPLQTTDLRHALQLGVGLGIVGGILLGIFMRLTPIAGMEFGVGTLLLCVLGGALFGGWSASLAGLAAPSAELKRFAADLRAGRILLMLDVPAGRVVEIRDLVHGRVPEARDHGEDPAIPAFP
jgi:hypothetical protein